MRPDVIPRQPSICEDGDEAIHDVVRECPAIDRIGHRPRGIIKEDVRQKRPCDPRCFLRRIVTGVLEGVRKDGNETGIVRRLRREVGSFLLTGKENRLRGERAAVRLNPFPARAVQPAMPRMGLGKPRSEPCQDSRFLLHPTSTLMLQDNCACGFASTANLSSVSWNAAQKPMRPATMSEMARTVGRLAGSVSDTLGLWHITVHPTAGCARTRAGSCDN